MPNPAAGGLEERLVDALQSLLKLDAVEVVVEVGCGSSPLALSMAPRLKAGGRVLGFDINSPARRQAAHGAESSRFTHFGFENGNVYALPIPDAFADLVLCKSLLCILDRPDAAIREMMRVLKPGGFVAAIEPASMQEFYDPEDAAFTDLSMRLNRAFHKGWKLRGADQRVGLRVPSLFLRAGLREIVAEAVAHVHLLCDERRSTEGILEQLKTEASVLRLPEATVSMIVKGGITRKQLEEHGSKVRGKLARFSSNPAELRRSGYIRLMPSLLVTVGRKGEGGG